MKVVYNPVHKNKLQYLAEESDPVWESEKGGYIPYTGATGAVDLGANDLTVDTNVLKVDTTNDRVGIGTDSPEGTLEVAGTSYEDNIPAMTTDTAPSPLVVSASTVLSSPTYAAFKAFNKVSSQYGWIASSGTTTGWLKQDLGESGAKTIESYSVAAVHTTTYITAVPKDWTFEGSNDDSNWTVLDTQTDINSWEISEIKQFQIASPASYRYYRINISANNGHATYLMVSQLRLLESVNRTRILLDNQSTFNLKGIAGQFSNLQSWKNSSDEEVASMATDGRLTTNSLTTGAIQATTGIFSSYVMNRRAMITTPAYGFMAISTAALVGTPVRISPSMQWRGHAWNTSGTPASKANSIEAYLLPVSGDVTSGSLIFANDTVDGVADSTEIMRLTTDGNVGIGTTSPNANAILDVTSVTKAFMPPRMTTTQRDAISSPTAGMVIYNTTTNVLNFHNGTDWGAV